MLKRGKSGFKSKPGIRDILSARRSPKRLVGHAHQVQSSVVERFDQIEDCVVRDPRIDHV